MNELQKILSQISDLEGKLDEIRKYKIAKTKFIQDNFFGGQQDLKSTLYELTQLADTLLVVTTQLARQELRNPYGLPSFQDSDANYQSSDFAIIGMGKLGAHELHFGSDLDLLFVFSRNGETRGQRAITNQEYFSKLAQKIISFLGIYTRYGYVYRVDTELRPSGKSGTLVTNLDSWISYYHELAATWEKQALLKARLVDSTGEFSKDFNGLFRRLIFLKPFPETLGSEIHHLRLRIEKELAKETPTRWHYKKGMGGLVDIEFAIQYLQLKLGKIYEDLLLPNTLDTLAQLDKRNILKKAEIESLHQAYYFYRTLEIILEVQFHLKEGYLDIEYERIAEVASAMAFKNENEFVEKFRESRLEVRKIYLEILKIS